MISPFFQKRVSSLETFLIRHGISYTLLILYVVVNLLLFLHAAVVEESRHTNFQKYTTTIARASGAVINLNVAGIILVASRTFVSFLRETSLALIIPVDYLMPGFHIGLAIVTCVASAVHSIFHLPMYILLHTWSPGVHGFTSLFITGVIACVLLAVVCTVALQSIRRNHYEVFRIVHSVGFVAMYVVLVVHGSHYGIPSTWRWIIAPVALYICDYAVRIHREKRSFLLVNKHSAAIQSQCVLRLRIPRVFHFQAGQYAELKVPSISRIEWHPFTIASAPHEPELVFYVKAAGDWTTRLFHIFETQYGARDIAIYVRGPYGAPAQHVDQFEQIMLIGGGVGATPFCSVFKSLENWISNWTPKSVEAGNEDQSVLPLGFNLTVQSQKLRHEQIPYWRPTNDMSTINSQLSFYTAQDELPGKNQGIGKHASPAGELPFAHLDNSKGQKKSTDLNVLQSAAQNRSKAPLVSKSAFVQGPGSSSSGNLWDTLSHGSDKPSISFWTAFTSVFEDHARAKTYQESLNLMLSMNYGSATLARSILVQRARRNAATRADAVSSTLDTDLHAFHDRTFIFLMYSRSVTVNLFLLWILILRAVIGASAALFGQFLPLGTGLAIYKSVGLMTVDTVLGTVIALGVGVPAIFECYELGLAQLTGLEIFSLLPAAVFSMVVDILALSGVGKNARLVGYFHVFFIWPLIATLFLYRLVRTIGERVALGEGLHRDPCRTRCVDFLWTSTTHEDDNWLVGEVLPYAKAPVLNLHRFITRSTAADNPWQSMESPAFRTQYGRPDWVYIFNHVAEKSQNGAVIGVFVCSQKAMANEIEAAAQGAMRNSIVRGLQNGTHPMRSLEEIFGDSICANPYTGDDLDPRGSKTRGCNIKFVFHKERFS